MDPVLSVSYATIAGFFEAAGGQLPQCRVRLLLLQLQAGVRMRGLPVHTGARLPPHPAPAHRRGELPGQGGGPDGVRLHHGQPVLHPALQQVAGARHLLRKGLPHPAGAPPDEPAAGPSGGSHLTRAQPGGKLEKTGKILANDLRKGASPMGNAFPLKYTYRLLNPYAGQAEERHHKAGNPSRYGTGTARRDMNEA